MLLASKFDHCLADLLYRWRIGELQMDITGIVANHPRETYRHIDLGDVPFHHLPVAKHDKAAQEAQLLALIEQTGTELVVLARYMQVLSAPLVERLAGRCINIHHSFLPGFKGVPRITPRKRAGSRDRRDGALVTADLAEARSSQQDHERVSSRPPPTSSHRPRHRATRAGPGGRLLPRRSDLLNGHGRWGSRLTSGGGTGAGGASCRSRFADRVPHRPSARQQLSANAAATPNAHPASTSAWPCAGACAALPTPIAATRPSATTAAAVQRPAGDSRVGQAAMCSDNLTQRVNNAATHSMPPRPTRPAPMARALPRIHHQ